MADKKTQPWPPDFWRPTCPSLAPSPSPSPNSSARACSAWPAPPPPRRRWRCAPGSSCEPPPPTSPPTCASPPSWAATTTPSQPGASASPSTGSRACATARAPADRRSFPPLQRLHVVELATLEDPAAAACPAGSWSLDELALTILREAHGQELLAARLAGAVGAAV